MVSNKNICLFTIFCRRIITFLEKKNKENSKSSKPREEKIELRLKPLANKKTAKSEESFSQDIRLYGQLNQHFQTYAQNPN